MNPGKKQLQQQKRILGSLRAILCALMLVIVIIFIHISTKAVTKLLTPADSAQNVADTPAANPDDGSGSDTENTPDKAQTDIPLSEDNIFTVCIDAGHGGKDGGSVSNNRKEKDDNLRLALALASYLEDQNINVVTTRSGDTYPTLSERCKIANEAHADYFISLHRNKGNSCGVETFISYTAGDETTALGTNIMDALVLAGIQRNRGLKKGSQNNSKEDFYVNSHTDMSACIIEMGFLDDSTDNRLFDDKLEVYAKAIGDAVIKTYNTYHLSGTDSDPGSDDSQTAQGEDNIPKFNGSHTLNNPRIDNISSLDNTTQDWGPGSDTDELNRPHSALSYQDKYEKYNANFIAKDTGDKKLVYLTMDEGYEYGFTSEILDTLKAKQVPVVFFLTMDYAKDNPDLIQRMLAEGHALGNHSVTHPSKGLPSQSVERQQSEVMDNHNLVKETYNYEMHLFRYPAGKFSDQSLAVVNNCNYKSVFWSFAYLDYDVNNQPDQAKSLEKLVKKLHPGAIYLLHPQSATNTAILGDFIDQARAAGYEFALFD